MKTNKTLLLVLFLIVTVTLRYSFLNKEYDNAYYHVREGIFNLAFISPFDDYYYNHNNLPKSLNELMDSLDCCDENQKTRFMNKFSDIISLKKDKSFLYLPIYDKECQRFNSYVLISRGIDGRFNNPYASMDTISLDDLLNKLKLYNKSCWFNSQEYSLCDSIISSRFNYKTRIFGKKDYLVYYYNFKFDNILNVTPCP